MTEPDQGQVVCLGDVMVDVLARLATGLATGSDAPGRIRLGGGGSAANTACWLAAAGAPSALIGCIGTDEFGDRTLRELAEYGVAAHLARAPDLTTGTCLVLIAPDGERTMVPDVGANAGLTVADLPEVLFRPPSWLHVSGYALFGGAREAARAGLARARSAGLPVSVDAGSSAPLRAVGARTFLDDVGEALVFANLDEARVLTGQDSAAECARALAAVTGEAVVKSGPHGAHWSDGVRLEFVPALPLVPIDTTGAGDAFAAGVLAARLRGRPIADALAAGHGLAAQACQLTGGRPPRPADRGRS